MRSTSKNTDVFNSEDEIYLAITEKKKILFLFYTFDRLHAMSHLLKNEMLKIKKGKILANPNNFGNIFVKF